MTSGLSASVEESKLKTNEYVLKIQEQKNKEKAEKERAEALAAELA
jgi:hypothetical protein